MSEFKVAIVGAGNMAREHIKAFNGLDNVSVVGIHSRTYDKATVLAAEFSVPFVSASIDELKSQTQADLVVVTVPELAANQVAKECFKHDWALLLEKPAGYDFADAEDIYETSKSCKRAVMVGFNRRFYSSTLAVIQDLNARPGEKRFIHVQDQQSYEEARYYNHPEAVVEKFMYANSIHNIDFLANIGRGDLSKVTPVMPWKGEETNVVLIHLAFTSGDTGLYEGIWKGPGPWSCSVSTPSRRWTMQPLEQARYQNANERKMYEVDVDPIDHEYKAGFFLQAQEAVKKAKGQQSSIVDIAESMKTMRMINQMFGV